MTMKFWCAAALMVPMPVLAQTGGGQLPRAQMEAQIRANFARMDLNKDGAVTRQESAAARDTALIARMNAAFNAMDGDKNGSISRAEFVATNRNAISRATGGKPMPDREFDGADANKDGRVTVDESLMAPLRQFDAADANRDGVLSPAERQVAASRQRQRR
jgi:EF hand